MNRLEIEFPRERNTFEPGEEIDLTVSWELEEAPERIELRLVWNTSGKGTTDLEIVQAVPFEFPSPFETRQTRMTLPGSPYSFSGKLITLQWGLELIAFPSEESTRREIVIAPSGTEVRLKSIKQTEQVI
ncbi:MAG: hypothetical protein KDA86_09480 [Planctomycetaceae bacterium]|nr:hypothetical protein [Planctomycetaceae bacterium]